MKILTNKGTKIEFNDHHFLKDYLTDNHNRIVVRKPTQVGVSFTTLLKVLYSGDGDSLNVIYTLPTNPEAREFVVSKFDPMIERSAGLRKQVRRVPFKDKPIWSSALKRIGESYYFFKGSWVAWKAQSIDADILVVDELDLQKEEIRLMFEERLEGSGSKDVIYWVGYPSIPNYGISSLYEKSDQREWFIQCPHCNLWQTLEWPLSISRQKRTYVCKSCRKDLSDDDRKRGVWKAKYPDRNIHGYSINKLMSPWISAAKILKAFFKDSPKHFHNFTLGLPYQEKRNELTDEMLKAGIINDELFLKLRSEHVVCGIDQGDQFHLIPGTAGADGEVITGAEILKSPKELEDRLDYYKPEIIIIDMMPDKHIAKLLQAKYGPNQFFLGNLRTWSEESSERSYFRIRRDLGIVDIERTESLDSMMQSVRDTFIKFRESVPYLQMVFQHLKNLVPDYEDRYSRIRKVWKKTGPDHFAHALNFFFLGCQILFPGRELIKSHLVSSVGESTLIPGSRSWVEQDFEKAIRRLANPEGVIIIPPKSFKRK